MSRSVLHMTPRWQGLYGLEIVETGYISNRNSSIADLPIEFQITRGNNSSILRNHAIAVAAVLRRRLGARVGDRSWIGLVRGRRDRRRGWCIEIGGEGDWGLGVAVLVKRRKETKRSKRKREDDGYFLSFNRLWTEINKLKKKQIEIAWINPKIKESKKSPKKTQRIKERP